MEYKLPELGEGVHEGELVKWLVKVGDQVKEDQPLCEIMTDKATMEVPAPFKGKITSVDAKEGEVVRVGQTLVHYEGVGSASAGKSPTKEDAPAKSHTPAPTPPAAQSPAPTSAPTSASAQSRPAVFSKGGSGSGGMAMASIEAHSRVAAAPATRKLAREKGVDLSRVEPSGPNGRVMKEDVERFVSGGGAVSAGAPKMMTSSFAVKSTVPSGGEERVPFKGLRKKISEKMRLSKDNAAHFTYVEEADCTELVRLRTQAKETAATHGIKLTYLPFVMKAMVAALKKYPILNSTLDEETHELVYKYYYNIGLSIQTEDGLTAPVIKDVGNKSILQIAKDIQDTVERARAKKLTLDDFHGGTITLTNAGSIGGLFATPIINFPEVAILGFNKISRKPVVLNNNGREEIAVRDWTYFSISLDHRVVDGAIGAEFMKQFIQYIENPALHLLESSFFGGNI